MAGCRERNYTKQKLNGVKMEFRKFISFLEKNEYLQKVTRPVNWKYEIGEIARENHMSPLLFENIVDYPGCRLFTGGLSRIDFFGVNLGMKIPVSRKVLIDLMKQCFKRPLQPVHLPDIAVYSLKSAGEVNLYELPVPWWNPLDGGRYIGTWHLNITADPLTGCRNSGVYRMQIIGENQASVSVSENSHLAMHMRNAEMLERDLEMAVAIGVDEVMVMAAASSVPLGFDEFSFAGALLGRPVRLRRCNEVKLEVPIDAEYVLEGIIKRGKRVKDGPYLDYAGKPGINPCAYLFEVRNVAIRPDAIFRGMSVGVPGAEDHQLFSVLSALNLVNFHGSELRQRVQNFFLKYQLFSLFQLSGRLGTLVSRVRENTGEKK